jgi:polysaccharide export outer membrane protein
VINDFVLSPGDEIEVKFMYWPELNETQTVRPDGRISLQYIDNIFVAGMTPEELDTKLTELYTAHIQDPEITVFVRNLANQRIYVAGEVQTPGMIEMEGPMTLLDAIMAGGGFENLSANQENVILFRHKDNVRYARSFNIEEVLTSPVSETVYLAPNDIVFVTRLGIDKANQWVDQHIVRMVPGLAQAPNALLYSSLNN